MSRKKVGIIDYGIGNLLSIYHAFNYLNAEVTFLEANASTDEIDYLVLPGVGAFNCGMKSLATNSLQHLIYKFIETGKPMMGICLGMQMLFSESDEFVKANGLDILPGKVSLITDDVNVRLPFIGWSDLALEDESSRILKGVGKQDYYYFVHSFSAKPEFSNHIKAKAKYRNHEIVAVVEKDNVFGCQFHPEKSSKSGLKIIQNFLSL